MSRKDNLAKKLWISKQEPTPPVQQSFWPLSQDAIISWIQQQFPSATPAVNQSFAPLEDLVQPWLETPMQNFTPAPLEDLIQPWLETLAVNQTPAQPQFTPAPLEDLVQPNLQTPVQPQFTPAPIQSQEVQQQPFTPAPVATPQDQDNNFVQNIIPGIQNNVERVANNVLFWPVVWSLINNTTNNQLPLFWWSDLAERWEGFSSIIDWVWEFISTAAENRKIRYDANSILQEELSSVKEIWDFNERNPAPISVIPSIKRLQQPYEDAINSSWWWTPSFEVFKNSLTENSPQTFNDLVTRENYLQILNGIWKSIDKVAEIEWHESIETKKHQLDSLTWNDQLDSFLWDVLPERQPNEIITLEKESLRSKQAQEVAMSYIKETTEVVNFAKNAEKQLNRAISEWLSPSTIGKMRERVEFLTEYANIFATDRYKEIVKKHIEWTPLEEQAKNAWYRNTTEYIMWTDSYRKALDFLPVLRETWLWEQDTILNAILWDVNQFYTRWRIWQWDSRFENTLRVADALLTEVSDADIIVWWTEMLWNLAQIFQSTAAEEDITSLNNIRTQTTEAERNKYIKVFLNDASWYLDDGLSLWVQMMTPWALTKWASIARSSARVYRWTDALTELATSGKKLQSVWSRLSKSNTNAIARVAWNNATIYAKAIPTEIAFESAVTRLDPERWDDDVKALAYAGVLLWPLFDLNRSQIRWLSSWWWIANTKLESVLSSVYWDLWLKAPTQWTNAWSFNTVKSHLESITKGVADSFWENSDKIRKATFARSYGWTQSFKDAVSANRELVANAIWEKAAIDAISSWTRNLTTNQVESVSRVLGDLWMNEESLTQYQRILWLVDDDAYNVADVAKEIFNIKWDVSFAGVKSTISVPADNVVRNPKRIQNPWFQRSASLPWKPFTPKQQWTLQEIRQIESNALSGWKENIADFFSAKWVSDNFEKLDNGRYWLKQDSETLAKANINKTREDLEDAVSYARWWDAEKFYETLESLWLDWATQMRERKVFERISDKISTIVC